MELELAEKISNYLSRKGFYTELIKVDHFGWQVKVIGIKLGYEFQ